MSIKIKKYQIENQNKWDNFLYSSKYYHFFFKRNYLDSNRKIIDNSFMFYKGEKLIAILPANLSKDKKVLSSHDGVSFGGLIKSKCCKTLDVLEIFERIIMYAKSKHIGRINYKLIPFIYSSCLNDEERFVLKYFKFREDKFEISSYVNLDTKIRFSSGKKENIKKFKKISHKFQVTSNIIYLEKYWSILEHVLKKHSAKPTHSFEEINNLIQNFKNNIKPFFIINNENLEIISGVILFENDHVVHTQYIASNDYGKKIGSNDYLISYLIDSYKDKKFFSFGKSSDKNYKYEINRGLLNSKEGFGSDNHTLESYYLVL
jgi:hypothetical protein